MSGFRRVGRAGAASAALLCLGAAIAGCAAMSEEEQAACDAIEEQPFESLQNWLEQPENWVSGSDLASMTQPDRSQLAEEAAQSLGCPSRYEMLDALNTYTGSNDYEQIWPAGCLITDTAWDARTEAVLPAVESFVNNHPNLTAEDDGSDSWEAGVSGIMAEVGCVKLRDDLWSRHVVASAVRALVDERDELAARAESTAGMNGGTTTGTYDVSVSAPDLNPFYCSWSLRAGFNCGVSLR